eukprot:5110992-Prymnesium_polylepis.1
MPPMPLATAARVAAASAAARAALARVAAARAAAELADVEAARATASVATLAAPGGPLPPATLDLARRAASKKRMQEPAVSSALDPPGDQSAHTAGAAPRAPADAGASCTMVSYRR